MNNATIPYVTRNLRHLLAAPNLTETQRTIITRTLATLSEEFPEHTVEPESSGQVTVPFGISINEYARASVIGGIPSTALINDPYNDRKFRWREKDKLSGERKYERGIR